MRSPELHPFTLAGKQASDALGSLQQPSGHGMPDASAATPDVTYRPGMRVAYNKLIRDRIPQIIEAGGHRPVTHVLDEDSYHTALLAKLVEEAQEASNAAADDLPSELADIVEVLRALAVTAEITWDGLLSLAAEKRFQRGGFEQRLFLEYVEEA
jgi:predicted house-cleaning noncanonical NTP pyrophosphatase (MazG superfamily)